MANGSLFYRSVDSYGPCAARSTAAQLHFQPWADDEQEQELPNTVPARGARQQAGLHVETLNTAAFCALDSHGTAEHPKIHILGFHACFSPAVFYCYCLLLLSHCNWHVAFTDNVLTVSLKTSFRVINDLFLLTIFKVLWFRFEILAVGRNMVQTDPRMLPLDPIKNKFPLLQR